MKTTKLFKAIFTVQAFVNLVGALGPEISFDALWYHLPIARLAIERGWWGVIPGGLLYTTGAPRLADYANAGLLWVGQAFQLASPEVLVKLGSWIVGLLCAYMIYRIARRYVKSEYAWGAVVIWYGSLVVGWQSIVAYVDLHRSLIELIAIWFLLRWWKNGKVSDAILSGIFWGCAYSVKMLAGIDLVFVTVLIGLSRRESIKGILGMGVVAAVISMIWGLGNVIQGYHFFYPFYGNSSYLHTDFSLRNTHILSPLFLFWHPRFRTFPLVIIPLIIAGRRVWEKIPREIALLTLALFMSWWFAPSNLWKGDGRYFLPTLSMMAVSVAVVFANVSISRKVIVYSAIIVQGIVGIAYRSLANVKFVPYVLGYESKQEFLMRELNFDYGDWYDVNGEIGRIVGDDKYIVYGAHNSYYLPGNYYHFSFAGDECYPYVLVQGKSYDVGGGVQLVYVNEITRSDLYMRDCE